MAWQDEVTETVRILIGDMSDTPTYSDERIERVAIIAAHQMINDIVFPIVYTVSISNSTITPDPADSPRDDAFIYLLSLKTSCLIMSGETRTYAISSMKITDGPSSVDTGPSYTNVKALAGSICDNYQQAKMLYVMGTLVPGAAIMTPTTQEGIMGGFLDSEIIGRNNNCRY